MLASSAKPTDLEEADCVTACAERSAAVPAAPPVSPIGLTDILAKRALVAASTGSLASAPVNRCKVAMSPGLRAADSKR